MDGKEIRIRPPEALTPVGKPASPSRVDILAAQGSLERLKIWRDVIGVAHTILKTVQRHEQARARIAELDAELALADREIEKLHARSRGERETAEQQRATLREHREGLHKLITEEIGAFMALFPELTGPQKAELVREILKKYPEVNVTIKI